MGLKSKFCANCGKEVEKTTDGFCTNCLLNKELVVVPSTVSLKVCPKCKSIFLKGLWIHTNNPPEYYLKQMILTKSKVSLPVEIKDVRIEFFGKKSKVTLKIVLDNKVLEQPVKTKINLQKFACPSCSREKKQTYQAIIQIRSSKDPDVLIKGAHKFIKRYGRYIVSVNEHPTGIDIYFSEKESAMNLSKTIKQRFNLKMGTSVKAFSWDKQKNRPHYRTTIILKE